jgi:hypothetical protein
MLHDLSMLLGDVNHEKHCNGVVCFTQKVLQRLQHLGDGFRKHTVEHVLGIRRKKATDKAKLRR